MKTASAHATLARQTGLGWVAHDLLTAFARSVQADALARHRHNRKAAVVLKVVADHYGITVQQLTYKGRQVLHVEARVLAGWLLAEVLGWPANAVNEELGRVKGMGKYYVRTAKDRMDTEPALKALGDRLAAECRKRLEQQ